MEKKHKKIGTLILIMIAIIVLAFVIINVRKTVVISSLSEKAAEYSASNNYKITIYNYSGNTLSTNEIYYLNGDALQKTVLSNNGIITETKLYEKNGEKEIYIDTAEDKVKLEEPNVLSEIVKVENILKTESLGDLISSSLSSTINTKVINGKEVYEIINFKSDELGVMEENCLYIDKETGLPVRVILLETKDAKTDTMITNIQDYIYEFDSVKIEDLEEPNEIEYTIQ